MKTVLSVLSLSAFASAHGYVRSFTFDNTVYPGFDPHQDPQIGAKRVVYSWGQGIADGTGPVVDVESNAIACNTDAKAPALVAKARAGSEITFQWTPWVINHKGPISTWMAPYHGDLATQDINKLKFFKIDAAAIMPSGKWATDELMDKGHTWNSTIPHDLSAGKYVVRHELLALHFATGGIGAVGTAAPQFYIACAAVDIEGPGTSKPEGLPFPGAYKKKDPGLVYALYNMKDLNAPSNKANYSLPGPKTYVPSGVAPKLAPRPRKIISPTGNPEQDAQYYKNLQAEAKKYGEITEQINGMPMGKNGKRAMNFNA